MTSRRARGGREPVPAPGTGHEAEHPPTPAPRPAPTFAHRKPSYEVIRGRLEQSLGRSLMVREAADAYALAQALRVAPVDREPGRVAELCDALGLDPGLFTDADEE